MIDRLLDVKPHFIEILEEQEIECENLTLNEWKKLQAIQKLLDPFHHHTNITCAEDSTTIAMVIPVLKELELHLEETKKTAIGTGVAMMANKMLTDMKKRFQFITDTNSESFDPIFVASTFLNPAYRGVLSSEQVQKAKLFIKQLIMETTEYQCADNDNDALDGREESEVLCNEIEERQTSEQSEEPLAKRFKHLSRLSMLLEKEETRERATTTINYDTDLNEYSLYKPSDNERRIDPLDYWVNHFIHFCDILVVPASTAPVECIFSTGGKSTSGKRNQLTGKNLERERRNKKYL